MCAITIGGGTALGQDNGYRLEPGWARLPGGLQWGQVVAVDFDRDGNVFALHRCGADSCVGRSEPAILKFDPSGELVQSWGAGMFVWPHGLHIDRDGFIWVSDGRAADGRGHQVFKLSASGEVLMTLGTAGEAGADERHFDGPTDIAVAPDGDIFVADGHGNNRVVRYAPDGTYVTAWGRAGAAPGEFNVPHAIAVDSRGRVLVGDRDNGRIQIFDRDGRFLEEWTQFGAPSGFYLAAGDVLYVAHALGISAGRTADGVISVSLHHAETAATEGNIEDVGADAAGNIYAGLADPRILQKLTKD
ncbi:MAG TPA: peptidyl-alpha-hydroxyglycine alpha-amidating lyase family protein [Gammaproteobacteria bacterium]